MLQNIGFDIYFVILWYQLLILQNIFLLMVTIFFLRFRKFKVGVGVGGKINGGLRTTPSMA